jgi:hypothetical protein
MARAMLEEDTALPAAQSQLDLIKDLTGVAYLAGSDTTVGAVIAFFLAMLVYPDVQAKAQAEVDRVVGRERLPELEDAENLPYVQAVASECLRWLPVLPLCPLFQGTACCICTDRASRTAVAHSTTQDDEYKGYFIPKGSIVLGSVWYVQPLAEARALTRPQVHPA